MRHQWDDLPAPVRDRIGTETGTVHTASHPAAGTASEFAATLTTATGRYFCKAHRTTSPTVWMLRKEAQAAPLVPGAALHWDFEQDGWLVLGFEHVPGRHPDLGPGSPDLPILAALLARLAETLTPAPQLRTLGLAQRWAGTRGWQRLKETGRIPAWAVDRIDELDALEQQAPDAAAGNTLAHTDMCGPNILIHQGAARTVDWAWPGPAAAWLDTASMIPRLIAAGHTAEAAYAWASTVPPYADANPDAVRAVASLLAARWAARAAEDGGPWLPLTEAGRAWCEATMAVDRSPA